MIGEQRHPLLEPLDRRRHLELALPDSLVPKRTAYADVVVADQMGLETLRLMEEHALEEPTLAHPYALNSSSLILGSSASYLSLRSKRYVCFVIYPQKRVDSVSRSLSFWSLLA